jgi:NAD(P)-dependent dehydrogenase (short-subunit alcohol dehydrogenase family)
MASFSFNLEDEVFVITGGSRGIGLEIAKLLLNQKARVVICGRKQEGLEAAAAALSAGDNLKPVQAHVAKSEDVDRLFETAMKAYGRIDGLINNVGMNIATGLVDADPGLWNKIIDSNLNGAFLCSRKAGHVMRDQKKGKILSISSIAGRRSAPFMGIYGVAKAGIEMMTKVMAQELAPFNVQVNAVAPCMVRTKFSEPFWSNAELHDQIVKGIPMGRIAEPADVAWPVLFLCSQASDFITGQTLMVDGGASAV